MTKEKKIERLEKAGFCILHERYSNWITLVKYGFEKKFKSINAAHKFVFYY